MKNKNYLQGVTRDSIMLRGPGWGYKVELEVGDYCGELFTEIVVVIPLQRLVDLKELH